MDEITCPACAYVRQAHDSAHPGICPACGIAYVKWQARQSEPAEPAMEALTEAQFQAEEDARPDPPKPLWLRLYHYACFMPSDRHESAFWGHSLLYVFFVFWGWRFILNGLDWSFIGSSFLHQVNLPFHEYGHIMFSGFGEFWMLLGGSLFQVLLPWIPLVGFLVFQRDNFAASLMLWWSGQNLIDVAPYIADAPTRILPLIGGNNTVHDWWAILTMTGSLDAAGFLAGLCFALGAGVILLSNLWGGHLLWIELRGRTDTAHHSAPPE